MKTILHPVLHYTVLPVFVAGQFNPFARFGRLCKKLFKGIWKKGRRTAIYRANSAFFCPYKHSRFNSRFAISLNSLLIINP